MANVTRSATFSMGRRVSGRNLERGSVGSSKSGYGPPNGPVREARVHVVFTAANAPQWAQHRLGKVPKEWHVVSLSGGGVVYSDTPLSADNHRIGLKCTVAGVTAELVVR